jgi:cytochrome c-type biogenesis protein CcmH/NrfG
VHLVGCAWAVLIVLGLVDCPLTWAEDWARRRAGQGPPTEGFVDRYLDNVIYPDRYVNLARLVVALVVAGSWVGAYLVRRRRRARAVSVATATETATAGSVVVPRHADTKAK